MIATPRLPTILEDGLRSSAQVISLRVFDVSALLMVKFRTISCTTLSISVELYCMLFWHGHFLLHALLAVDECVEVSAK